jgi:hypothetical protein
LTIESDEFDGLPPIRITPEALQGILQAGVDTNGVFSCNSRGEVWPAKRHGKVRPDERTYLDLPALEEIVAMIVQAWPSGGRFRVSEIGVALVANEEPLFAFELIAG